MRVDADRAVVERAGEVSVESQQSAFEGSPRSGRAGTGTVVARSSGDRTVLAEARADSPLRFLQPKFPTAARGAALCVVTFGGGLVDGDAIDLDLVVEAGATLVVFTQSPTKVFRGASSQKLRAKVFGTLVLLPDPVAAFSDADYTQRVDVELGPAGGCVLLDGFTAGRAAFGDRWAMRALDLRTTITCDGHTIVKDALRLATTDGSIAARMLDYEAYATLIAVGQAVTPVARAMQREPIAPPTAKLAVASSTLPRSGDGEGGAIVRIAASSSAEALRAVRARLRNLPDIEAVDPFAARY